MCLAPPLCKFWSRHSCKWLPVFVIHSPFLKRLPWMLPGDLPSYWPGFVRLSRNCKHLFLDQAKMHSVRVLFTQGPPYLCTSEGFLDFQCMKDFIWFFFQNPSFPKRDFWWYLLAFSGTEEKIEATLSCLDKRRKIKSWSNFILPKRKDRHKRICQREESHNQRRKTMDFVCLLDI